MTPVRQFHEKEEEEVKHLGTTEEIERSLAKLPWWVYLLGTAAGFVFAAALIIALVAWALS